MRPRDDFRRIAPNIWLNPLGQFRIIVKVNGRTILRRLPLGSTQEQAKALVEKEKFRRAVAREVKRNKHDNLERMERDLSWTLKLVRKFLREKERARSWQQNGATAAKLETMGQRLRRL